jgi:hypothetical protein
MTSRRAIIFGLILTPAALRLRGASAQTVELARIKNISVQQDADGRVFWASGAAVDADGSNGQNGNRFAYRVDDEGLDALANAGWPNHGWRNVLIDNGHGVPTGDGQGNWYSQTTYVWKSRPLSTRYVDATATPYIVVNPIVRRNAVGIVIGCRARVTYAGNSIDAVVADVSGAGDIGELSIKAAQILRIPDSPRNGGVARGVTFEMWPGRSASVQGEDYELQST